MGRTDFRSCARAIGARMSLRLWGICVATIVIGIGAFVSGCMQASTAVALRDDGVPAQATIVQVADYKGIKCAVRYEDFSGVWHSAVLDNQCRGLDAGETIPVRYLRSDPSAVAAVGTLSVVYILINKSSGMFIGLVLVAFGVLGILAGTGVLGRWSGRTHARTS